MLRCVLWETGWVCQELSANQPCLDRSGGCSSWQARPDRHAAVAPVSCCLCCTRTPTSWQMLSIIPKCSVVVSRTYPPAAALQWDPPALAYAFHTSFIDCSDGGVLRATGGCMRCLLSLPTTEPLRGSSCTLQLFAGRPCTRCLHSTCALLTRLAGWLSRLARAPACNPCLASRTLDVPGVFPAASPAH